MDFIKEVIKLSKKNCKKIVFPEGDDPRIVKAAYKIKKLGIAKPILITDKKYKNILTVNHLQGSDYSEKLVQIRKDKGLTLLQAKKLLENSRYYAMMMLYTGEVDGLISGAVHSTVDTLLPAFQIIKTKKQIKQASGVMFIILNKRVYLFADCGVNPSYDSQGLAELALLTGETALDFGIKPKVALLSFSTFSSAKDEMVDKVRKAVELAQKQKPKFIIDGEMQVDTALVPEVAKLKAPESKIQGDANVLIFPDLNSGNIGYKLVQRMGGAKAIGPVIQGLRKPVNDLSRGCIVEDIVNLTAITVVQAQKCIS